MTIQERLRARASRPLGYQCDSALVIDQRAAADRIDALEAALRQFADWAPPADRRTEYGQGYDEALHRTALIAQKALDASK